MNLNNKITIVTGAASGFSEEGHRGIRQPKVLASQLLDLHLDKSAARADRNWPDGISHVKQMFLSAQMSKPQLKIVCDTFGVPDIVVNNAGYTQNRPLAKLMRGLFGRSRLQRQRQIHLHHMVQAVVPMMRDNGGGCMLNVGSVAGIRPRPG